MFKHIRKYKHKKGFTIIELLVVIAVIAVLVLVAAPRFIGKTNEAKLAQIKHDVRVAEEKLAETLVNEPERYESWSDVENGEATLQNYINSEKLFGRGGPVQTLEPGPYKELSENFLNEINTHLTGDFYANGLGTVYYRGNSLSDNNSNKDSEKNNIVEFDNGAKAEFLGWSEFGLNDQMDGEVEFLGWSKFGLNNNATPSESYVKTLGWSSFHTGLEKDVFNGLNASVFDGDLETYHKGVGTVSWDGDIAGKNIRITGQGATWAYDTYPKDLLVEFRDVNGQPLKVDGKSNTKVKVAGAFSPNSIRVNIPDRAVEMVFLAEDDATSFAKDMRIYEIEIEYEVEAIEEVSVKPVVSNHFFSFSLNQPRDVIVHQDWVPISESEILENYVSEPLDSSKIYHYELEFVDDLGKSRMVNYEVRTGTDIVTFKGLSPEALDGNLETYHRGVKTVTWDGNLAGKNIRITGQGASGAYGTYPKALLVEFRDESGNPLLAEGHKSTKIKVAGASAANSIRVTVPDNSKEMVFLGEDNAVRANNMRIYEIEIEYEVEPLDGISITPIVSNNYVTFSLNKVSPFSVIKDYELENDIISSDFYESVSLYSNEVYHYELEFKDHQGEAIMANFQVKTSSDIAQFRGLSPEAFDGDIETHHKGVGTVTWNGDLAGKDLRITGHGDKNYSSLYKLEVEFQDKEGNPIPPLGSSNNRTLISNTDTSLSTVRLTVPENAVQMRFYAESRAYNMAIYEIEVEEEVEPLGGLKIEPMVTNNKVHFKMNNKHSVRVYRNKAEESISQDIDIYESVPLYSGSDYLYELEFNDERGNRKRAKYKVTTGQDDIVFRGLSPEAFDGDIETYHKGVGTVTWIGDLGGRDIDITGHGDKNYSSRYKLEVEFQDKKGNPIPPLGSTNNRTLISNTDAHLSTVRLTVPESAVQMSFYAESRAYNMAIYEVQVAN